MDPATSSDARVLVLEPDDHLASSILSALREIAPNAVVDVAHSLEEAQRKALGTKPDLFVLDVDATYDLGQEFLYDLRTSHPNSRAIILTATHLTAAREQAAGIGAIHFLEKPFPHNDFVDLAQALLRPSDKPESEKFQGTLSDLHMADIIQLKCMSGTTAAIEFTSPSGEKGRVYFENGQVRHATAPGKEGMEAFNEIVTWKGGRLSEVQAGAVARSINLDWQILLMEAMRKQDEAGAKSGATRTGTSSTARRRVLVIDDSPMLLNFVKEILTDANYDVTTGASAAESLSSAKANPPELILLDYILPDMKGDEVTRKLMENPATAAIPVVYMSGFGADLRPDSEASPNVIGSLNKPFTSDLLIKTVETHMPKSPDEPQSPGPTPESEATSIENQPPKDFGSQEEAATQPFPPAEPETAAPAVEEWWSAPPAQETWAQPSPSAFNPVPEEPVDDLLPIEETPSAPAVSVEESELPNESVTGGSYFCGDTSFFSLNWALQTIAKGKLTGILRSFWHREPVDLFTKNGEIVLATTRDPELYCAEAPITLVNVDQEKIAEARAQQRENGCPLFITLAQGGHILQEPSMQLVQHYGQKLFANLWTAPRVRFTFEQSTDLPPWAHGVATEGDVDHWALATLRLIQFQDLGTKVNYDQGLIPGYTRDGFERVQNLRLTVAEAQFASQFNGARSIQQIAKNLRLDLKFARLTLFRFLALEIVECWPPTSAVKPERKGVLQRFTRSIGIGE
jgi:DNA-binding response OmpR family regulator